MDTVTLRFESVSYRYAGATEFALRDVGLEVQRGQALGIVGPNGAGKTTLCLCAVGLAPGAIGGALEGAVSIDGSTTADTPVHELAQRAGILFQESQTQITSGALTVWEEIAFGPRNLSLPDEEVVSRTWTAIDALGLDELVERDPGRLSGGQAQLVALAAVLALRPRYLVLDEPTSQLDPVGTRLVGDTLSTAARQMEIGIVIVEHKTELLAALCDEIVVIVGGRIVARDDATTVLRDERLHEWGVAPPADVVLRAHVEAAGLRWDEAWL